MTPQQIASRINELRAADIDCSVYSSLYYRQSKKVIVAIAEALSLDSKGTKDTVRARILDHCIDR